jgi:hypothetical protein
MAIAGPAPFDLVRMARRLARALEKADPIRGGAYAEGPPIAGPHLGAAERGYFLNLVANHLNRHTQAGDGVCPNGQGPCKARGAAYALLEVIHFEADEHSEEQEPARALRDTLAALRIALDRAALDLEAYLEACDARHTDELGWARGRSHRHEITCERPEILCNQVDRWLAIVAAAQADTVEPQFHSMTSKARLVENRRQKLRTTVESLLREDGWLLREILDITEEVPSDEDEFRARLESIKKRLAGVHRRGAPESAATNGTPTNDTPSVATTLSTPSRSRPLSAETERAGDGQEEVAQVASEGRDEESPQPPPATQAPEKDS